MIQEKLDLQDKLTDTQAEYNTLYSEHEELKQKFEKERQSTGTVGILFYKRINSLLFTSVFQIQCF